MSRPARAYPVAVLVFAFVSLSLPALSWASSGGGGLQGGKPSSSPGKVQPGNVTVTASGNGVTVATRASGFLRNQLRFAGSVPAGDAGDIVEIERLGHQTGWKWAATAHSRAAADGSFTVIWRANHIGRFQFRAVIRTSRAHTAAVSPALTATVYMAALATLYGPGLYGNRTACGQRLRRKTLGVASRTLPCGTQVAIYYGGRTIVVPVIDRGPYANGADWDLTEATGRALHMPGTETIGAVSLPQRGS